MSRKPSKSIQAIAITLLAGMVIPKIFDLSGNVFIDKLLWKGVLSIAFNLATIVVGTLYAGKFIKGRIAGGKSRISIYFILIAILASIVSVVCEFIREISPVIKIILCSVAIFATTFLIIKLLVYCKKSLNKFKLTQEKSLKKQKSLTSVNFISASHGTDIKDEKTHIAISSPNTVINERSRKTYQSPNITNGTFSTSNSFNKYDAVITNNPNTTLIVDNTEPRNKTLFELWAEKDNNEKCLTATNDENPDLKWVKIYRPPYPNGKFYGYVMMCNAHNTVNGEIYFADRSIWRTC
jgi:hypothetical protein